jgi:hypothetical protein
MANSFIPPGIRTDVGPAHRKSPADNLPGPTDGIRGKTLIRHRQWTFEKFRRYVTRVSAAGKPVKRFYSTFHLPRLI